MRRAAVSLLLVSACVVLHGPQPTPRPNEAPWGEVRDRLTRSTKVYDLLDDRAFATATYLPIVARTAALERVAAWRSYTDQERTALLESETNEAAAEEQFILAFYTGERLDNDLITKRSIWRVALVVGDLEIQPTKIEEVRIDTTLRKLYPYIGEFDKLYRIRFPAWKGEARLEDNPFTLLVAGAPARVKLEWKPGEPAPKHYNERPGL